MFHFSGCLGGSKNNFGPVVVQEEEAAAIWGEFGKKKSEMETRGSLPSIQLETCLTESFIRGSTSLYNTSIQMTIQRSSVGQLTTLVMILIMLFYVWQLSIPAKQ